MRSRTGAVAPAAVSSSASRAIAQRQANLGLVQDVAELDLARSSGMVGDRDAAGLE